MDADRAGAVTQQDQRLSADLAAHEVSGLGNLGFVPDVQPALGEQRFAFLREDLGGRHDGPVHPEGTFDAVVDNEILIAHEARSLSGHQ